MKTEINLCQSSGNFEMNFFDCKKYGFAFQGVTMPNSLPKVQHAFL